jgi:hypothetical protein
VETIGRAQDVTRSRADQVLGDRTGSRAPRRKPPARSSEVPAREALWLRDCGEQRLGLVVLEREEREPFRPIDESDDTRREAAEPSAGVVEQHGPSSH